MPPDASTPLSLTRRLRDGLERLLLVLRADQWQASEQVGLKPAQTLVLTFLGGRGMRGMRIKEIARHLGVTQPTVTDTVNALERKALVEKTSDATDARVQAVVLTQHGRDALRVIGLASMATDQALDSLSDKEKTELLTLLVKLIRALQESQAIPLQRMCVSCSYFAPHVHADQLKPHHCRFVDAAFGPDEIRLDCQDHHEAPAERQARNWSSFTSAAGAPHPM